MRLIKASAEIGQDELVEKIRTAYPELCEGKEIRKVIYVPGKIINFIL